MGDYVPKGGPRKIDNCIYYFEAGENSTNHINMYAWRWKCGCGARGRWQTQSPTCVWYSWRAHTIRKLNHQGVKGD